MQKNFFYYLLPSIGMGIIGAFVMVPITTYYLTPKDFGIFAVLNAITMPIGPLASTGIAWVLAGNFYKIDDKERRVLFFNLLLLDFVLKIFWVLVFWLSAPLLLPVIIKEFEIKHVLYFKLILVSILLTTFWPSISCLIVFQQKGKVYAFLEFSQWAFGALTTIICLVLFKLSTITLFLSPIAAGLFSFIAGLWYIRNYIIPKISRKWSREVFVVGIPSMPYNLLEMVTNVTDRYFIQKWINLPQLGIYSHSLNYKNIFAMAIKAFSRTFGLQLTEIFSKDLDRKSFNIKLRKWYGLLGIIGIFVTLFSYEVINILTHGKFVAAAPLVPLWFLFHLFSTYGMPYTQFLLVNKKNAFMMYSGIITNVSFIGVTAISIYYFGIIGAAVAIVLLNFVIQSSRLIYARKLGCDKFAGKEFLFILALLLGTYVANTLIKFDLMGKIFGYLVISFLIVEYYGLFGVFMSIRKKIFIDILALKEKGQ